VEVRRRRGCEASCSSESSGSSEATRDSAAPDERSGSLPPMPLQRVLHFVILFTSLHDHEALGEYPGCEVVYGRPLGFQNLNLSTSTVAGVIACRRLHVRLPYARRPRKISQEKIV
jgi:hypothetical protein